VQHRHRSRLVAEHEVAPAAATHVDLDAEGAALDQHEHAALVTLARAKPRRRDAASRVVEYAGEPLASSCSQTHDATEAAAASDGHDRLRERRPAKHESGVAVGENFADGLGVGRQRVSNVRRGRGRQRSTAATESEPETQRGDEDEDEDRRRHDDNLATIGKPRTSARLVRSLSAEGAGLGWFGTACVFNKCRDSRTCEIVGQILVCFRHVFRSGPLSKLPLFLRRRAAPPCRRHVRRYESIMLTAARRIPRLLLPFTMGLVVLSFVGATLYSQLLLDTDVVALDIVFNAGPSIAEVADARGTLPALDHAADDFLLATDDAGRAEARARYVTARSALERELADYELLPGYPGETDVYERLRQEVRRLDGDLLGGVYGRGRDALPAARAQLTVVDEALRAVSDVNRKHLQSAFASMARAGRRRNFYALALDAVAVVIATIATVLVTRTIERQLAVRVRRAKELEHLAIQVGHEIANPLTPIQVALRFAGESGDEQLRKSSSSAERALARIRASIDRLADFAKASQPPATPSSSPLSPAVEEIARAAGGGAVSVDGGVRVACPDGQLRDILRGLVAGSIAPGTSGAVAVSVATSGSRVRILVESPSDEGASSDPFDPQLRDPQSGLPGLDLRLATVRRLVEAFGGAVGVRQRFPRQCLWVELPRA